MKINKRGQVTIPQAVREKSGLHPGTEVEFELQGRQVLIRKARGSGNTRGRRLVAALRGKGTVRMTTDQIMALTRD